jgi:hypothetical protein
MPREGCVRDRWSHRRSKRGEQGCSNGCGYRHVGRSPHGESSIVLFECRCSGGVARRLPAARAVERGVSTACRRMLNGTRRRCRRHTSRARAEGLRACVGAGRCWNRVVKPSEQSLQPATIPTLYRSTDASAVCLLWRSGRRDRHPLPCWCARLGRQCIVYATPRRKGSHLGCRCRFCRRSHILAALGSGFGRSNAHEVRACGRHAPMRFLARKGPRCTRASRSELLMCGR